MTIDNHHCDCLIVGATSSLTAVEEDDGCDTYSVKIDIGCFFLFIEKTAVGIGESETQTQNLKYTAPGRGFEIN